MATLQIPPLYPSATSDAFVAPRLDEAAAATALRRRNLLAEIPDNQPAFVMQGGEVIRTPSGELPGPLPPITQVDPRIRDEMIAADQFRQQRQYQDELDLAEEFRRRQDIERFLSAGLVPPKSMTEPESSKLQKPQALEFMKVGDQVYAFDKFTGMGRPVAAAPAKDQKVPAAYITQERWNQIKDLPEFKGLVPIPKGIDSQGRQLLEINQKRSNPIADMLEMYGAGGFTPPVQSQASSGIGPASSRYRIVER